MADNCIESKTYTAETPLRTVAPIIGQLQNLTQQKEKRTYKSFVDKCSGATGTTTVYDITDSVTIDNTTLVGKWSVDAKEKQIFTLNPARKDFNEAYRKAVQDPQGEIGKTSLDYRNQVLLSYISTSEGSSLSFNGVKKLTTQEVNDKNLIGERGYQEIYKNGISDIEGTKPWPLEKNLYYPSALEANNNQQDYIQFKIYEYKSRMFTINGFKRLARYYETDDNGNSRPINKESIFKSEIRLPIQGGISDSNVVTWNADPLNAVQQAAQFSSLTIAAGPISEVIPAQAEAMKQLVTDKKISAALVPYFQSLFARMAVSSENNFFSRAFGAIINPNLELLFQNPELRSFPLRFDLTPRDTKEAEMVRKIIRAFKQSMTPKQGVADLFLKTPMVYEIEYINGNNNQRHKSINRIKTCALRSCGVNYTPANQYMTYNDSANTMTAYSLDMQFTELEPVYYNDYDAGNSTPDEIGY